MKDSHLSQDPTSLFHDASGDMKQLLDQNMQPLKLTAGQTLFDQGDFDDRLYVLEQGILEISVLSAGGRKLALNRLRPVTVFGEIAIFDPGPRTARVEAQTECRLRAIRQPVLMAALAHAPALAAELLQLAGRRMRWMSRQMEDQVFLPPAARLAGKILYLMDEAGHVAMSQAQLADFVGVTREVVSKTLAEWRRDGFLDVTRGKIAVKDQDALWDIKNSDFV